MHGQTELIILNTHRSSKLFKVDQCTGRVPTILLFLRYLYIGGKESNAGFKYRKGL